MDYTHKAFALGWHFILLLFGLTVLETAAEQWVVMLAVGRERALNALRSSMSQVRGGQVMKRHAIIGIATLSLIVASGAHMFAQRDQPADKPAQDQGKPADPPQDRAAQQKRAQEQRQKDAATQQQRTQQAQQSRQQQQDQAAQRAPVVKQQVDDQRQKDAAGQQPRTQQAQQSRQQQQDQLKQREQVLTARSARQHELVTEQQTRLTQYRQHLAQQQQAVQQRSTQLQQQKRTAQFRFQQDYVARMRQQQVFLADHHPDYDHDPFFFTLSTFRYNRGGRFYETNQYGADLLRQGVNYGYQQGFNAGVADQQDHWRPGYEDSFAYQDANYGYNGYYVERDDYNYYFREGFRRGYDDGYNSRVQYGRDVNGSRVMLDITVSQVLGFQPIR